MTITIDYISRARAKLKTAKEWDGLTDLRRTRKTQLTSPATNPLSSNGCGFLLPPYVEGLVVRSSWVRLAEARRADGVLPLFFRPKGGTPGVF